MWRSIAVLGLLAASTAAVSAQERGETDGFAGCYAVELGEWQPPLLEGNESYQSPPDTVHLTEEIGSEIFEEGKKLARPVIPTGRTPSAYWFQPTADSVRLIWTNGFAGVHLHLQATDEGKLVGGAEATTDVVGPPVPETHATLSPTECQGAA